MDSLLLCIITFGGYIIMYRLYGKYLAKRIFNINPANAVPSKEFEDGVDYVPTKKHIIFGHHYTSIAGTGPIVGPAIAIIWGWLPAMLWIFLGSIFMGAVHDFGSLIISMRNQGKSISEITSKYMSSRSRFLFFTIVFFELWIVIAVFALVIAIIFSMFPISVFPVWMEIPIAILLGYMIYKKNANHLLWSIIAVIAMYVTVVIGVSIPVTIPGIGAMPATGVWAIILLIYAFIASVLPVTTLLQPRDYINSHELVIAMALLVIGIIVTSFTGSLKIVAPAIQQSPPGAPAIWPFLFITIACGAISGFHSLVSSGTSSKQVMNENDSLFVGYGSMLFEGALATLVVVAVAAGIGLGYDKGGEVLTGFKAWNTHYASWSAAAGLGSKLNAFIIGSANIITRIGIPFKWAVAVMGVFVASFAGTTLDSATRIQRYVVMELADDINFKPLKNRFSATSFAVITAAMLAFASGADGKGALTLWPLFGAVNQTLAALALILITIYLKQKGKYKWLISGIPAVFMSVMTVWAAFLNEFQFIDAKNWLLIIVNTIVILIVLGIIIEGVIKFTKIKGEAQITD
ncbi:MAG: carbon starvation protein A [Candidatus Cloacimonadota bacterium]|nr:MAG: carbon starvation protein A [Candidatus Cloacimonadota bacterium]